MKKKKSSFNSQEIRKTSSLLINEEEKAMKKEDRHILNVSDTGDSVVVEFAKHEDVEHEGEELEITDEVSMTEDEKKEK